MPDMLKPLSPGKEPVPTGSKFPLTKMGADTMYEGERDRKVLINRRAKRKADQLQRKISIHELLSSKKPKLGNRRHQPMKSKFILKSTRQTDNKVESRDSIKSPQPPKSISQNVAEKLAQDDAEIAALERKLGLKRGKSLPKAFQDDGLGELLNDLYEDSNADVKDEKRKTDGIEWLARKRKEARKSSDGAYKEKEEGEVSKSKGNRESTRPQGSPNRDDYSNHIDTFSQEGEDNSLLDSENDLTPSDSETAMGLLSTPPSRVRENPYVAPTLEGNIISVTHGPPVLQEVSSSDSEAMVRLRKQAQGAINRLTEANFISILGDIENLYQSNVRQHVTSTVVDLLLTSICSPTSLSDTFTILLAGFVAAVYKIIGVDVGAQFIQGAVDLFDKHYVCAAKNNSGKETSNLISFLAGLYNFHVIGSKLIFDYLRLFLDTFSELNTELILKIIRTSGSQLRQEDQSSLKDIIKILRPPVAKLGSENVSVRTMFMIDMINDLRNNRVKTGLPASVVTSEHIIRMKKILGTLSNRYIKSSEPLHVCLDNIRESGKKGKWWLIGANGVGKEKHKDDNKNAAISTSHDARFQISSGSTGDVPDFIRLSQEQRMNTDIRQAIFITMISASDFQDAYYRLMKLKLKKTQEFEIPKVLIHCSSAENAYNPYYTLVAKTLCRHRSLKRAFRFSLWNIFKKLGENYNEDDAAEDDDDRNSLDMRQLVNLAKMFGSLIADGSLNLNVLKYLNFRFLKPKTKVFIEVLLITVLLQSQANIELGRDEISVTNIISNMKDTPQVAEGLYYFMKKVVSKTDISGGRAEMETIRWGCKIAAGVLREIVAGCDDSTRAL